MSDSGSAYLRAFAQEAAGHVVDTDFAAEADDRRLLLFVDADTDDPAIAWKQLLTAFLQDFAVAWH